MGYILHRFLISGPNLGIDAGFCLFTPSFVHRFLISGPDLGIDAGFCLFTPYFVHRFLISGPNLGIDARISRFTATCMHRFLISCPDLRIDARFSRFTATCVHRFLISGPDLRITAAPSSQQCGMARLLRPSPQLPSASDSNFRCRKGEWSRLRQSLRQRVPAFDPNIERRPDSKKGQQGNSPLSLFYKMP